MDWIGHHVVEGKVTIYDLWATVQYQLGFEHKNLSYLFGGRNFRLSDIAGQVIHHLIVTSRIVRRFVSR